MTKNNPVLSKVAVQARTNDTRRPTKSADVRKSLERMGVKFLSK